MFVNFNAPHHTKTELEAVALTGRFAGSVEYRSDQLATLVDVTGKHVICFITIVCRDGLIILRGKVADFELTQSGRAIATLEDLIRA